MDWKVMLTTFGAIFLAELGDKTQLACVLMASKTGRPWSVFVAASAALILVTLIGCVLAQVLAAYIPENLIKKGAAVGFMAIGALMLWGKI